MKSKSNTVYEMVSFEDFFLNIENIRKEILEDKSFWEIKWGKSPVRNVNKILEQKEILGDNYVYERNITYKKIETEYLKLFHIPDFLTSEALLYNSGISTIINSLRTYIEGYKKDKIKIVYTKGYFETEYYLLENKQVESIQYNSLKDLIDKDILFIEPVLYSEKMNSINYLYIIYNFLKYNKGPKYIVIDCTLVTHLQLSVEILYKILGKFPNTIITIVESLLKLHQLGMEISSGGLGVTIYSKRGNLKKDFENFNLKLIKNRELYSDNLTLNNLRGLAHPFMYNEGVLFKYSSKIFKNNEFVAKRIDNDRLIINHPSFNTEKYSWNVSPMIIITLKNADSNEYKKIIKKIESLKKQSDVKLDYGSSFGFFYSRYELINYSIKNNDWFLKIAIGYDDTDLEEIIFILNEL